MLSNLLMYNYHFPHNIKHEYLGFIRMYPFMISLGVLAAIFASWCKIARRKLSEGDLVLMSLAPFIILFAILGASFFGKIGLEGYRDNFWGKFNFFKEGLSIHGAVLFGCVAGFVLYHFFVKPKYRIASLVYADCIIPNILLGQAIGRWGNFFNHELLGKKVGTSKTLDASNISAINWLPPFIRDNLIQSRYKSELEKIPMPQLPENGEYIFYEPLFLYESLALLILWIVITFIVPKLFTWFSKKPWKLYPQKFPLNKMEPPKLASIKNSSGMLTLKSYFHYQKLWFSNLIIRQKLKKQYWKKAYYDYQPPKEVTQKIALEYEKMLQKNQKNHPHNLFLALQRRSKAYIWRSNKLYVAHNPDKYFIMRPGVQTSLYFFGWNLIRFILEHRRESDNELFIIGNRPLSYAMLISFFVLGFIFTFLCQFLFARYMRKPNYLYETEYVV